MPTAALPLPAPPIGAKDCVNSGGGAAAGMAGEAAAPWAALDEPAEWAGFSQPVDGSPGVWQSHLAIEGIHCAACTLTLEQVLGACPGVQEVQVNGASATARVTWSPAQGRPSDWFTALARAGYQGLPASDQLAAQPRLAAQRRLLWRWLVAGFCMMQVMMYAVPAYLTAEGEITPDIQALLRWASWVLTLPVLVFSCQPFFASAWRDLRHGRVGMDVPVALGLAIAFAASTAATVQPAGPWGAEVWYDSITMFAFFLLSGRLLEQRLRLHSTGALESLMRRLPATAQKQRVDGVFERVPVRRLAAGDVVRVLPGEAFPGDGTVMHGHSQVDQALLTGESTPQARGPGEAVIAGSMNVAAALVVKLERVGAGTRYAQIVALMEQAACDKPRLAQLADRVAGPFLVGVLLAAAASAAWWWSAGPAHAIGIAVAVLIVTCPCALSLATPAATLAGAGALAARGVLLRRLQALEAFAAVDTVVFDKTGTLTQDRMALVGCRHRPGQGGDEAPALAAALAAQSLHPASRAIAAAFDARGWTAGEVREVAGSGLEGRVARGGLPPHRLRLGSAAFCSVPTLPGSAAGPQVHLAEGPQWLASFELQEALRADAAETVDRLRARGLRLQLLSGDRAAAVQQLGERAGIAACFGGRSPQEKLAHVRALQASGRRVAMVGDGMNDGPVLACADVSVAMGHAVPLAQARADAVVLGDRLAGVALLHAQALRTRAVVRQNLAWAALYNAVCVPLALAGWMPPWLAGLGMAGSSLLVVLNSARLARLPQAA